jgi:hypothetical protein
MAVMALLIAQLGALSHAYSHDAYGRGAHSHGAHAYDGYGHNAFAFDDFAGAASVHACGAGSHDPCGDCLAFAPLLSAAGATSALPFTLPQGQNSAGRSAGGSLVDLPPLLAFRSRAPPYIP